MTAMLTETRRVPDTIEEMEDYMRRIAENTDAAVGPGRPERISEAASVGDEAWQGDLGLVVVEGLPPDDYELVVNPTQQDMQLVPGNTQGARHCLDSLDGVTMYRPADWGPESLAGPWLLFSQERQILHPTHGHYTIPAGMAISCTYQRAWDKELQQARRAAD